MEVPRGPSLSMGGVGSRRCTRLGGSESLAGWSGGRAPTPMWLPTGTITGFGLAALTGFSPAEAAGLTLTARPSSDSATSPVPSWWALECAPRGCGGAADTVPLAPAAPAAAPVGASCHWPPCSADCSPPILAASATDDTGHHVASATDGMGSTCGAGPSSTRCAPIGTGALSVPSLHGGRGEVGRCPSPACTVAGGGGCVRCPADWERGLG